MAKVKYQFSASIEYNNKRDNKIRFAIYVYGGNHFWRCRSINMETVFDMLRNKWFETTPPTGELKGLRQGLARHDLSKKNINMVMKAINEQLAWHEQQKRVTLPANLEIDQEVFGMDDDVKNDFILQKKLKTQAMALLLLLRDGDATIQQVRHIDHPVIWSHKIKYRDE